MSFAKLIQNRECHVIIFQQMVGDSISNPRSPLSWPEFQQLVSSFLQQIFNKSKKTNKQTNINQQPQKQKPITKAKTKQIHENKTKMN